jgi:lipoyl(octanoyl) transferase
MPSTQPTSDVASATPRGESPAPPVEVHLLGRIDHGVCLALQQRLAYEATGRRDGRIVLLLCEHPDEITIGRQGSWADIRLDRRELERRDLAVRWIGRGGGGIWHTPGQLAVYPIVPLARCGFTVGGYLDRLQAGIQAALEELNYAALPRPGRHGLWGRGGQLAAFGVAVRHDVTMHGAFVNVNPNDRLFRLIDTDPWEHTPMSSLVVERRQPAKMTAIREALVRHVTSALDAPRYHLYTGHPLLRSVRTAPAEPAARAG